METTAFEMSEPPETSSTACSMSARSASAAVANVSTACLASSPDAVSGAPSARSSAAKVSVAERMSATGLVEALLRERSIVPELVGRCLELGRPVDDRGAVALGPLRGRRRPTQRRRRLHRSPRRASASPRTTCQERDLHAFTLARASYESDLERHEEPAGELSQPGAHRSALVGRSDDDRSRERLLASGPPRVGRASRRSRRRPLERRPFSPPRPLPRCCRTSCARPCPEAPALLDRSTRGP